MMSIATAFIVMAVMVLVVPVSVFAAVAPHVPTGADTDVCAMCHRMHVATGDATWETSQPVVTQRSALLVGVPGAGDTQLCYVCHGVTALGSGTDVQSSFDASSSHSLEPSSSAFGPPKDCSSCHDSHGSNRTATGEPYPRLLRSTNGSSTMVFAGDEFCASCHVVRPANRFPGLAVWQKTAHDRIVGPASGTRVVCRACHDPHGSPIAPLIVSRVATPSASVPATVTANDRTFCITCHSGTYGTWTGVYSGSAHASSTATAAIDAEYAEPGASRRVGECVNCHAPMGRDDGTGSPIAKLADAQGRALCDRCHRSGGSAATNLAGFVFSPTTPGAEIVAAFPSVVSGFGRVEVWSRESTTSGEPASPLERTPFSAIGALASGDLDGDGAREALVADPSSARLAMVESDTLTRVRTKVLSYPLPATVSVRLGVGDIFPDASGLPEVVSLDSAGGVDVLRLSGGALVRVASATVTGTPTGLACGNVAGSAAADIVITTTSGLFVLSENGGTLTVGGSYDTTGSPVAVAIGDLWAPSGSNEIAVANGNPGNTLAILSGDGTFLTSGAALAASRSPLSVVVGDILPNTAGIETVVAYTDSTGNDGVRVVEQVPGGGIGPVSDVSLGSGVSPTSVALGDADNDGTSDVVIALAGTFTRMSTGVPPSVRVLTPNVAGTALTAAFSLPAGGVEAAGGRPGVVVADLGAVPPSRHPVSVVSGSHNSTEAIPATRHVECVDCHSPHEASSTASDTPALAGQMIGAWGVEPVNVDATTVNLVGPGRAVAEFEVCFKCHGGSGAPRGVASEFNTRTASFHPVEGVAPVTNAIGITMQIVAAGDTIRCGSCHGTESATAPAGPHRSTASPLLRRRLAGAKGAEATLLCLRCHLSSVYLDGTGDGVGGNRSGFYYTTPPSGPRALHSYHTATMGMRCDACHLSHGGGTIRYLLRNDTLAWTVQGTGGSCTTECHSAPATPYMYNR